MCGIIGLLHYQNSSSDAFSGMLRAIQHRGPDAEGVWHDEAILLGHRRLSIIDLSPTGHQPMQSSEGRYVITYNGEIYNFLTLKKELSDLGHRFQGMSDTEVLLACIEVYGLEKTLKKLNGMFAFGLWDRAEKILYLARDRFGEKPLYYGWVGQTFLFASELKCFKAYPDFSAEVDQQALAAYLQYGYIPAPYSIYRGISKLSPGCFLKIALDDKQVQMASYWSALQVASAGVDQPLTLTEKEAIDLGETKLKEAVKLRMLADVPLGAFLSGGIDSSTIVALMQKQSRQPVKTFTIGFDNPAYNEAPQAKAVAQHLGTAHTEIYLQEHHLLDVLPKLPAIYDEPFADSSQIPTYLVSQITRQQVTVALSGDAGDELFGGYNRYVFASRLVKYFDYCPFFLRRWIAAALLALPPQGWDKLYAWIFRKPSVRLIGDKLHKLAALLKTAQTPEAVYRHLISCFHQPELYLHSPFNSFKGGFNEIRDYPAWMMLNDTIGYLPGDILTKVDRAGMAVSLESRIPFLDPAVFEFAWSLPLDFKLRGNQTKWLLRQILYRYIPRELVDRPKMGFGIPLAQWLRTTLRGWAESLLEPDQLRQQGYFKAEAVQNLWQQHLSGRRDFSAQLWTLLMFQAWLRDGSSL